MFIGTKTSRITAVVTAILMMVCMMSYLANPAEAEAASYPSNPRIVSDSSMRAGQNVTWDCVYFGSYPQTEIVDTAERCGTYGRKWMKDSDYEINTTLYSKLNNASWNGNETTIDGTKYRRIKKSDATWSNSADCYYNWPDSSTYHYFRYEPIKWRVLNVDGNDAFLLADKALDDYRYNETYVHMTWERSTIRSRLNGYGSSANDNGIDYSADNFMDSAFPSSSEQSAIKDTDVRNDNGVIYERTPGGADTIDKIFLLSEKETFGTAEAASYGFANSYDIRDEARRAESSTYAKAMGTKASTPSDYSPTSDYLGNCYWWLRSPGMDQYCVCIASAYGDISAASSADDKTHVARPALHLDLSSDSWENAGTVSSNGSMNEIPRSGRKPAPEKLREDGQNVVLEDHQVSLLEIDGKEPDWQFILQAAKIAVPEAIQKMIKEGQIVLASDDITVVRYDEAEVKGPMTLGFSGDHIALYKDGGMTVYHQIEKGIETLKPQWNEEKQCFTVTTDNCSPFVLVADNSNTNGKGNAATITDGQSNTATGIIGNDTTVSAAIACISLALAGIYLLILRRKKEQE